MTWAEFCIRLYAYKRLEKKEWYKVRAIAYQIYVSNWHSSKKKPLSIDKYMNLDNVKKNSITKEHKQAFIDAVKLYKKQKDGTA